MKITDRTLKFGKKAKHTYWGRIGCSHSMYSGGYNFYVYGIKGIFNYIIDVRWGEYAKGPKRI